MLNVTVMVEVASSFDEKEEGAVAADTGGGAIDAVAHHCNAACHTVMTLTGVMVTNCDTCMTSAFEKYAESSK